MQTTKRNTDLYVGAFVSIGDETWSAYDFRIGHSKQDVEDQLTPMVDDYLSEMVPSSGTGITVEDVQNMGFIRKLEIAYDMDWFLVYELPVEKNTGGDNPSHVGVFRTIEDNGLTFFTGSSVQDVQESLRAKIVDYLWYLEREDLDSMQIEELSALQDQSNPTFEIEIRALENGGAQ